MHELDDIALLQQYTEQSSEEAFAALVSRHINKVYSVALRHTHNPHSAEEITQAVFVILARKSRQLGKKVVLSGWLYETSRLTAVTFVRSEIRRGRREEEAHMQNLLNETESDVWPQIAPFLDAAMAGLNETDRHAIVLRFFDSKSMKDVGAALGASEDATKMRVNRAVEKLRLYFTKRGIVVSAGVLTAAISANSVQAAPAGLAVIISSTALSGTTITTKAVIAATKAIVMTTFQKTIVAAALVAAVGAGIFEAHQSSRLRAQNNDLQQQQSSAADQLAQLQRQRDEATNQLEGLIAENGQLKSHSNEHELLKLRGQLTVASRAAADAAAKTRTPAVSPESSSEDDQRTQTRANLKQFFKMTNLSPEKADQYVNLEVEMKQRQNDRIKALLGGTLSVADALRQRDEDNQKQQDQRREILGPDGSAVLQSVADGMRNGTAQRLTGIVQASLGNNPLTQEQSDSLQSAIKTEVTANSMDDIDLFRPVEEWTQMVTDHEQHVMQTASGFLTTAQLGTLQFLEEANLRLMLQQREQRRKALGINQ